MISLNPVFMAIVSFLCAVALRFVIPWLKSKTTETDRKNMLAWVQIAVAFVQQVYYQLSGADRLQKALEFLAEKGFDVNSAELRAAIEAEVLALHNALMEKA